MIDPVAIRIHDSADDFLKFLLFENIEMNAAEAANGMPFIYRGERTTGKEYSLLPTILRNYNKILYSPDPTTPQETWLTEATVGNYKFEEFLNLHRFYIYANKNGITIPEIPIFNDYELYYGSSKLLYELQLWIPDELFEIAGIAQHYGVPTSLLDWTFNPFTALYFAAMGAVEKYYNDIIKKSEFPENDSEPFRYDKNDKIVIWALRISDIKNMNKENEDINLKLIIPPYSRNPNLAAQNGIFTHEQQKLSLKPDDYSYIDRTSLDQKLKPNSSNRPILYKHMIPIYESNRILTLLNTMHHSASNIFPGFEGVAREVRDQKKRVFIKDLWRL